MSRLEGINYRILNADEFDRQDLVDIFEINRSFIPNPLVSHIQVAEKDGRIVALAVLQPQYHAEPIWVHPDYRGTKLHERIIESLLKPFEALKGLRIWIFAPDSRITRLGTKFGFKYKDYQVMYKDF